MTQNADYGLEAVFAETLDCYYLHNKKMRDQVSHRLASLFEQVGSPDYEGWYVGMVDPGPAYVLRPRGALSAIEEPRDD